MNRGVNVVPPYDVMLADGIAEAAYWEVFFEPVPIILIVDESLGYQPVIKMWSGKLPKVEDVLEVLKQHEDQ
ncbi:MAG: hypothetical protein JRJ73_03955 [Deltaproteobacteria bacterium]|nr:hypothetical protein [Deltaproteobacteria bacterium]